MFCHILSDEEWASCQVFFSHILHFWNTSDAKIPDFAEHKWPKEEECPLLYNPTINLQARMTTGSARRYSALFQYELYGSRDGNIIRRGGSTSVVQNENCCF